MDVREKLVELLDIIIQPGQKTLGDIADHRIAHGVTVQEWISVDDRLPEEPLQTVIVTNGKETCVAVYSVVYDEFGVMCGKGKSFGITHWMPLPQPPKGE